MANTDAQRIRSYVQSLDRDDRYILLLYYADGLTTLEISTLLGLSASSIDRRLGYFKNQLDAMIHTASPTTGAAPRPTAFA